MNRLCWLGLCLIAIVAGRDAEAQLVDNGEFDQDVTGWGINSNLVQPDWDPLDFEGSLESGSALVTSTETRLNTAVGITQCILLPAAAPLDFHGAIFVPSAQSEAATVGYSFDWRTGDCGARVSLEIAGNAVGADMWETVEAIAMPPPDANSLVIVARITFATKNDPDGPFQAHFDAIRLPEPHCAAGVIAAVGALGCLAPRRRNSLR